MPSTSPAARAFDRSPRTIDDARKLVEQDPTAAAEQAVRIATAAGLEKPGTDPIRELAKLVTLDRFEPDARANPKKVAKAQAIFQQNPQLLNLISTERTDISALGYSINENNSSPQPFYGRVVMVNNQAKFETPTKTYNLALGSQGETWREEVLTAFKDEHMTVTGSVTNGGDTLMVEAFAPGIRPKPLSGRLMPEKGAFTVGNTKFTFSSKYLKVLQGTQLSESEGVVDWSPAGVLLPGSADSSVLTSLAVKLRQLLKGVLPQHGWVPVDTYRGEPEDALYVAGRLMNERVRTVHIPGYGPAELHIAHTGYFRNTLLIAPVGMAIPDASLPLTPGRPSPFPEGDPTQGSTEPGQGPRVFFYGVPLLPSNPLVTPEILRIAQEKGCLRLMSLGGISHPADIGSFPQTNGVEVDVDGWATHLPTSVPEMTRDEMDFRTRWAGEPPRVTP